MYWALLALGSALLFGIWTVVLKRTVDHEHKTKIVALYPLIAAIGIALTGNVDYHVSKQEFLFIFMATLMAAFALYCHMIAMRKLPISIYAPLLNLSPVFLFFIGYLLLGETMTVLTGIGLAVTVIAAVLLEFDSKHWKKSLQQFMTKRAVIVMMLAALIVSFSPLFARMAMRTVNYFTFVFYFMLILSCIYWVFHIVVHRELPIAGLNGQQVLWLLLLGVLIGISDLMIMAAIAVPGTLLVVIITLRRLSTLFAALFGGRLYHEEKLLYRASMCLLMVLGSALMLL